jgi:hypothetical protein
MNRPRHVILCDVSSSMEDPSGTMRKIDVLYHALLAVWPRIPGSTLLAFSSSVYALDNPDELPGPHGGTALHRGLEACAPYKPERSLVISDGRPDSEPLALQAACLLGPIIDVIYCGPDSDRVAVNFMTRLAKAGGGRLAVADLRRQNHRLGGAVSAMLGLPA